MSAGMAISIVFYILIAFITIYLAGKVQGVAYTVEGQTRKSFWNRLCLMGVFLILFLCSALRFDIGNDYRQYTQTAHEAFVGGYVVT